AEDGQGRGRRGRRGRTHHPQSATVRASLTVPAAVGTTRPMPQTAIQHPSAHATPSQGPGQIGLAGLVVGAIGVVFGDIGTSPLYTIREAFSPHYGLVADHDTVLGVLSMIFWALSLVVTVKYVTIIMRADNDGEGGIMALMALAQRCFPKGSRSSYT